MAEIQLNAYIKKMILLWFQSYRALQAEIKLHLAPLSDGFKISQEDVDVVLSIEKFGFYFTF